MHGEAVKWVPTMAECVSTSCHLPDCLYGCMKEITENCTYKSSSGWILGFSKHVEDTIIELEILM